MRSTGYVVWSWKTGLCEKKQIENYGYVHILSRPRGLESCTRKEGLKPLEKTGAAANLQSSQKISISRACETKLGCILEEGENAIINEVFRHGHVPLGHWLPVSASLSTFFCTRRFKSAKYKDMDFFHRGKINRQCNFFSTFFQSFYVKSSQKKKKQMKIQWFGCLLCNDQIPTQANETKQNHPRFLQWDKPLFYQEIRILLQQSYF